jgi:hypothetical protein
VSRTILHDFCVEGVDYRLAQEGSHLLLYLRHVDHFGQPHATPVDFADYGSVLGRMAKAGSYAMFSSADWPAKWAAVSTATMHARHVLLGPTAAVEVCGTKARVLQKKTASGHTLEETVDRWEATSDYGAQQWLLDVMRRILEAP